MPHWRTDTEYTTVNSIFTWEFILSGGSGARVNRRASTYNSKTRVTDIYLAMYWIRKLSDLQNPPSGPPILSL